MFINFNWVVTQWQWLFYMCNMKLVTNKFKSGRQIRAAANSRNDHMACDRVQARYMLSSQEEGICLLCTSAYREDNTDIMH